MKLKKIIKCIPKKIKSNQKNKEYNWNKSIWEDNFFILLEQRESR
jgi:hypothetical protein